MAYSDFGAYIWKNGENITKECADTHYVWNGEKFVKDVEEYDEKSVVAGGHAVICLGDFCIEFLKVYNPRIVYHTGKKINTKITEGTDYKSIRKNLEITGFSYGSRELINMFEIRYKKDYYCVICGSQIGNGLDDTKVSKYVLNNIKYNEENKHYYIDSDVDSDMVIDKLQRLEEIKFEKYLLKNYGIKPLLADLIRFRFDGVQFHWQTCKEHLCKIKWLR